MRISKRKRSKRTRIKKIIGPYTIKMRYADFTF